MKRLIGCLTFMWCGMTLSYAQVPDQQEFNQQEMKPSLSIPHDLLFPTFRTNSKWPALNVDKFREVLNPVNKAQSGFNFEGSELHVTPPPSHILLQQQIKPKDPPVKQTGSPPPQQKDPESKKKTKKILQEQMEELINEIKGLQELLEEYDEDRKTEINRLVWAMTKRFLIIMRWLDSNPGKSRREAEVALWEEDTLFRRYSLIVWDALTAIFKLDLEKEQTKEDINRLILDLEVIEKILDEMYKEEQKQKTPPDQTITPLPK